MKNWSGTVTLKSNYAGLHEYTHIEAETFEEAINKIREGYQNRTNKIILKITIQPTLSKGAMDTASAIGPYQTWNS